MSVSEILASVDREIALLKQVRALLDGGAPAAPKRRSEQTKSRLGKASAAVRKSAKSAGRKTKKRRLSPEGRKRIAEAVRRRWEKQRKAAASK